MKMDEKKMSTGNSRLNDIRLSEEKFRMELVQCLSELSEKNLECYDRIRKEGRERLMVEMTAVRSRINGLLERVKKIGLNQHRYRFDSWKQEDLDRLHEYDNELNSLMTDCNRIIGGASSPENECTEVMRILGRIEKIFRKRMTIVRTMRLYG